jgi:sulfite reductase alpha subunit-like flavoprotein
MAPLDELRLLRQLLESRMKGLRICNEALEGEVPDELRDLMEGLRDEDAELISRLQRAIQAVMEGW